jgi:hypothetical protein
MGQIVVLNPNWQTNVLWPASLAAANTQAARLAKVIELDMFANMLGVEYLTEYNNYIQVLQNLATMIATALGGAPGGAPIGLPPGPPPPVWHHLYMARAQYVGPPPPGPPGPPPPGPPPPWGVPLPPHYPQLAAARNPKPECPEFFKGKSVAAARHFIRMCQNYMVIAPFVDPESEIRWALQLM